MASLGLCRPAVTVRPPLSSPGSTVLGGGVRWWSLVGDYPLWSLFLFPLEPGSLLLLERRGQRDSGNSPWRQEFRGQVAGSLLTGLWGQLWSGMVKTEEPKVGKPYLTMNLDSA